MKAVLSTRVDPDISERFREIAQLNHHSTSTFLRNLVLSVVEGDEASPMKMNDLLKTQVGLTTKILFLSKFLASGVDPEVTEELLEQADNLLNEKGLLGPKASKDDDHG